MNLMDVLSPYAAAIKVGAIVLVLGTAFGAGAWLNGNRWEAKYQKLESEYNQFKGGVAAIGDAAKARNAVQALNDLKAKERSDEENLRTHAADRTAISRLRDDADRARRSSLPPAPAGSSRPDLVCLDRAEYQRGDGEAVSRLRSGARSLADKGTAATIDLNTAKTWALNLKLSTTLKE